VYIWQLTFVCFPLFLESQHLYPGSLHHLVWLGLQDVCGSSKKNSLKPGPDFHCQVFEGLQLTCNNLNCAGTETLNRLDIDAFLYAAGKIDSVVGICISYTGSSWYMFCVKMRTTIIDGCIS
jgi:hypothetical protein